jgi:type I restriction enzyme S subunit
VQATGHIGYVRAAEEGFICGTGAIRLRLTERNGKVSADFMSHVLANPSSVEWFKFHAIGATMPNLNEGIIRSFPFVLPPPEDQQVIATFLSAVDDKIELNRRMSETLEAMARAIFKDWFVDFGPTRAKMEGGAPYLAPEIWALFPDWLNDEEKPEGWITSTIGQEVDVVGGSTHQVPRPLSDARIRRRRARNCWMRASPACRTPAPDRKSKTRRNPHLRRSSLGITQAPY